ncbi:MAG: M48 family metallopeptidase [Campylobacteraceae bacterium]|jgi:STE24 endopeptidase|nr:M48 family metallopeptidase [Campylobacteraceae bacterium]
MLILIGTLYFFYILLKLYISASEIGFVSYAKNLPAIILSSENYQKAAEYKIANERLHVITNFYDYALFLFWILFGLKALETFCIKDGSIIESVIFIMSFIVINYILTLPFDIYSTFVKDKKFGFSTIDAKTYLLDSTKSAVIFLILGGLVIALISWIISSFALWWFWSFVAVFVLILFINMFYPTLIAPIFNKFIPLENSELKSSIEDLMQKAGLKSSGIFTMDASKRDNRLNAYFGGLGKSKRVVLFDTLLKKLNSSELLSVLGHELGHFKHKDILKNIAITAALLFALFAFFGNLPDSVYEAFGIKNGAYSSIVIFLLLSSAVSFLIMPIFGYLSRKNEYKADKYGSECESKEALASALVKLADENKSFPRSHFLYIAFYHTHPPLIERLKALGVDTEK